MCMRTFTNKQITVLFNMGVSIFAAVLMGILLHRILGLPCWLSCGAVATTAVLTEYFLTVYPLFVLKYITLPVKKEEEKTESKKKCNKK